MPFLKIFSKKMSKYLRISKKSTTFAPAFAKWYMVHVQMANDLAGWMSDLVSGLQNRIERFDSATGLQAATRWRLCFYG